MKKYTWLAILAALVLMLGSICGAQAEILPPYGEGQIGLSASVLCEELTVRRSPSADSGVVEKLQYGSLFIVDRQSGGWAHGFLGDEEDALSGWVNADYIVIDPARYRTEKKTPVYAWNDAQAPKVALLDADTILPILADDGDWLVISLRGAAGWIRKGPAD